MELNQGTGKKNLRQLIPVALIGVGLIILGFAGVNAYLSGKQSSGFSVIPSEVNFPAPELILNDLSGKKVSISEYRDKIVLINNWATWCPPCRDEMPTLLKYYRDHSNQGFVLLGIEAGDPADDVTAFANEYHLTFPILLDPNNRSLNAFNNDSLPSSYVIDHNGTVVLAWNGPINRSMLEKYLTPLLEQ